MSQRPSVTELWAAAYPLYYKDEEHDDDDDDDAQVTDRLSDLDIDS